MSADVDAIFALIAVNLNGKNATAVGLRLLAKGRSILDTHECIQRPLNLFG